MILFNPLNNFMNLIIFKILNIRNSVEIFKIIYNDYNYEYLQKYKIKSINHAKKIIKSKIFQALLKKYF